MVSALAKLNFLLSRQRLNGQHGPEFVVVDEAIIVAVSLS